MSRKSLFEELKAMGEEYTQRLGMIAAFAAATTKMGAKESAPATYDAEVYGTEYVAPAEVQSEAGDTYDYRTGDPYEDRLNEWCMINGIAELRRLPEFEEQLDPHKHMACYEAIYSNGVRGPVVVEPVNARDELVTFSGGYRQVEEFARNHQSVFPRLNKYERVKKAHTDWHNRIPGEHRHDVYGHRRPIPHGRRATKAERTVRKVGEVVHGIGHIIHAVKDR